MAEGDAAGGRDSGGANCGGDEVYDKNGVSDGAVRTETDDQPGTACKDGAGAGMRSGIRVGAVAPLAGGSGDGTCGTGVVEEEVYEKDREQGNEGTREQGGRRAGGLANQQVSVKEVHGLLLLFLRLLGGLRFFERACRLEFRLGDQWTGADSFEQVGLLWF
jgi:hypothetical protein